MWKEKYYFAFIVLLSFVLLLNPIHALSISRVNGTVGFNSIPIQHIDYNFGKGIENLADFNSSRIDKNCYNLTMTVKPDVWADVLAYRASTMTATQFQSKWLPSMTLLQVQNSLTDIFNAEPVITSQSSKVTGTLKGSISTVKICFSGVGAGAKVHVGRYSVDLFLNNASVDLFVTPETVQPYYNDNATGLHYYSQAVRITNNSNSQIQLDPSMFSGVGISYTLMADVNTTDLNYDGDGNNNNYSKFTVFDSNLFIDANATQNVYFNYVSNKSSGKWDFHFYWKDMNGNTIDYLIDPYWSTSVFSAPPNLFADWNKSSFIYSRSSDGSWEATGELDWNLASRNDTNYTSWSGQYNSDYNLPSDTNLVGLWHFNSITKNDNVVTGKVGNALTYNASSSYVYSPNITIGSAGTMSAWFKPNLKHNAGIMGIYSSSPSRSFNLYVGGSGSTYPVSVFDNGSGYATGGTISDTSWHQAVVTWNGQIVTVYLDGNAGTPVTFPQSLITGSNPITIGAFSIGYGGGFWDGSIDNARVWDTNLSAIDVNRIFMDENTGVIAPDADLNRSHLLLEYKFDENSNSNWGSLTPDTSGNAKNGSEISMLGAVTPDASGNGYDANVQGGGYLNIGTSTTGLWKTNAGVFNGSTSYADANVPTSVRRNKLSLFAWVKTTSTNASIVSNGRADNGGWGLATISSWGCGGKLCLYLNAGYRIATTPFNDGTWHQVGITMTDTNILTFYVDGRIDGSYASPVGFTLVNGENGLMWIGNSSGVTSFYLNGNLDEIMYWERALSASEVLALYNKQKGQWLDSNLVGYWKFNLASGTTVFDSARGNNGTLTGSGANINAQGMWDTNAFNGNGSSQYTLITTPADLNVTTNLTVCTWAKYNGTTASAGTGIVSRWHTYPWTGGTVDNAWLLYGTGTQDNNIAFVIANAGNTYYAFADNNISVGIWNYLCGSYDGASLKLYINGTLQSSPRSVSTTINTGSATTSPIKIGAYQLTNDYFGGQIDETKIWNRTLSANEIQSDYNQWMSSKFRDVNVDSVGANVTLGTVTVNKTLNYNFNKELETSASNPLMLNQLSVNSSMGASSLFTDANLIGLWHFNNIRGNDNVVTGKVGNALNFNGVNNYVNLISALPTIKDYNVGTISLWFKAKKGFTALEQYGGANNEMYVVIGDQGGVYTDESITFLVYRGGSAKLWMVVRNGTPAYYDNNWHQVVVRINGSDNAIFVDNNKQAITYQTGNASTQEFSFIGNTGSQLLLGIDDTKGTVGDMNGIIDQFRIWNTGLSDADINRIYMDENGGSQAPSADLNRSSLIGEWLMDENKDSNYGSLTPDTSTNANHGAETNMIGAVTPDSSPKHYDGNLLNGAYLATTSATTGNWTTNSASFTANQVGYIDTNLSSDLNGLTKLTISQWINPSLASSAGTMFSRWGSNNTSFINFLYGTSQNQFCIATNLTDSSAGHCGIAGTLTINQWTHVVMVYDGTADTNANRLKVYYNTVQQTLSFTSTGIPSSLTSPNATTLFSIGKGVNGLNNNFAGKIEETALWTRSLSLTEIQTLYNSQAGNFNDPSLVGLWHLNDKNANGFVLNSVTGVRDGNLNGTGVIQNTGLWNTSDANLYGLGYGQIKIDGNKTNTGLTKAFTLSAWIKPNTGGTTDSLPVSKVYWTSAGDNGGYGIRHYTQTNYCMFYNNAQVDVVAPVGSSPDGVWTMITCVYDGGKGHIYVNGIEQGTGTTATVKSVPNPFVMGGDSNTGYWASNGRYFQGQLEDVALWNTNLTAQQVSDLYRKGVSRLDLNIISFSDAQGNTPTTSVSYTDINNNTPYTANILGTYFNTDEYFKQGTGFDGNAGVNFVGSYLEDLNMYYYDVCNPTQNFNWYVTTSQVCQNKKIDINSGILSIGTGGSLTLIDSNMHSFQEIDMNGSGTRVLQLTRSCMNIWNNNDWNTTINCQWR